MAEESMSLTAAQEVTDGCEEKQNSIQKPICSKKREKRIPLYLRTPSTTTCHESCKHKHTIDETPKRPVLKRTTIKKSDDVVIPVETSVSVSAVVKTKARSTGISTLVTNSPEVIKKSPPVSKPGSPENILRKQKPSLSAKPRDVSKGKESNFVVENAPSSKTKPKPEKPASSGIKDGNDATVVQKVVRSKVAAKVVSTPQKAETLYPNKLDGSKAVPSLQKQKKIVKQKSELPIVNKPVSKPKQVNANLLSKKTLHGIKSETRTLKLGQGGVSVEKRNLKGVLVEKRNLKGVSVEKRNLKSVARRRVNAEERKGSGGQKVVLRHQDVQKKKETQVLLNNVIEETVKRLGQNRKSKVETLVGAFETVIVSLKQSKVSGNKNLTIAAA